MINSKTRENNEIVECFTYQWHFKRGEEKKSIQRDAEKSN